VEVGMWVAPVHEPFAPVAHGQLALGHREPFEIEHAGEAEPGEGAGVHKEHRLDRPHFAQRPAPRHRIGTLEGDDRLGTNARPGGRLRPEAGRREEQREAGGRGRSQSDSAAAARAGASAARR
jgi:hypothetical protein